MARYQITLEDAEDEMISITIDGDPDIESIEPTSVTPAQECGLITTAFIVNNLLGAPSEDDSV